MAKRVTSPRMDCTGREGTKEALEGEDSCRSNLKALKRTPGALRQKARHLGISIGHRQRPKKRTRRS